MASTEYSTEELNLGLVLAQGQILQHHFTLTNRSERPIRLLTASSSFPCCSSIGPIPGTIPPGGEAKVPVVIKTQNKSGPLRIGFTVTTDSSVAPVSHFGITVRLIPEWQIEEIGQNTDSLSIGESGKRIYRITCRRMESSGLCLPESVTEGGPLRAVLKAETQATNISGDLIESNCEVAVDLLPSPQTGRRQGEILFKWLNGLTRGHVITWNVKPSLIASPSGLVISRSKQPATVTVVVTSRERDIRILRVDGPLVKTSSLPTESSRKHCLRFMVDTSKVRSGDISDITITTDHPNQSSLTVTLLFSAPTDGGES